MTPESIATLCVGCGIPLDSELPSWQESVNLTPDFLMLGGCIHEVRPVLELDVAWDWCGIDCFGLWLARAVVYMQAEPRP